MGCNLSLYIAEFLPHNVPMRKKKPSKSLSKKTTIQHPAMEPERQPLCSVQNSCTGPCPALKAALAEKARLEASLLKGKTRLFEEKARLEAEQRELQRMLLARQRKASR